MSIKLLKEKRGLGDCPQGFDFVFDFAFDFAFSRAPSPEAFFFAPFVFAKKNAQARALA
ncbi:MAG: hypothetical protein H7829_12700 [Magnetococcus sp. THC-1_WYH]